jgi:hypothetical protein
MPEEWTPDQFRQLGTTLFFELYRFQFIHARKEAKESSDKIVRPSIHQKEIVRLIITASYGLGYNCALFYNVKHLLEYLPIGSQNFWHHLSELKKAGVTYRLPDRGRLLRLCVNPQVDQWLTPKMIKDEEWKKKVKLWMKLYEADPQLEFPQMPVRSQTLTEALSQWNLESYAVDQKATPKTARQGYAVDQKATPQTSSRPASTLKEDLKGDPDSKLKALRRKSEKSFASERDYMDRLAKVLPTDVLENDGGKWRNRFRAHPKKSVRVLEDAEEETKRQAMGLRIIHKPGAFMEVAWQEFHD